MTDEEFRRSTTRQVDPERELRAENERLKEALRMALTLVNMLPGAHNNPHLQGIRDVIGEAITGKRKENRNG